MSGKKLVEPRTSIVGKRFGKLLVVRFVNFFVTELKNRIYRQSMWECRCDCGCSTIVKRNNLVTSNTKSCGCLNVEKCNKLKGKGIQSNILPFGVAALNAYFGTYKYRAKKRLISFDLSIGEFQKLIYGECYFCGQSPSRRYPTKNKSKGSNGCIYVNGVDRLASNKGYNVKNCVSCCEICNKAKRDLTLVEFVKWIERIKKYANLKITESLPDSQTTNC